LEAGACDQPWLCSDVEKQDDTHWCYKALKNFEGQDQAKNSWANDLHGWVVLLDLSSMSARVSDRATMDPDSKICPASGEWHDRLFSTLDFADAVDADIAVNANFFLNAMDVHSKTCARPYGLCMHDAVVQHRPGELGYEDPNDKPRQEHNLNPKGRVAVLFDNEAGKVKAQENLVFLQEDGSLKVSTGSFREGVAGNWLVKDGIAVSQLELNPVPVDREARTAVGWIEDEEDGSGGHLLIVVVEKRAFLRGATLVKDKALPEGMTQVDSGGISLVELSQLMLQLGVTSAVNLDGGGSSNLCGKAAEGDRFCSVPSDYHVYDENTPGVKESERKVFKFRSSPCQLGFLKKPSSESLQTLEAFI